MSAALPWLPQGTVYGALLNFRREWDLWAPQMTEAPYKAAPQAPVLYIKTANTFAPCGAAIAVPAAYLGMNGAENRLLAGALVIMVALVIFKHRANVGRLLRGTEPRIVGKRK